MIRALDAAPAHAAIELVSFEHDLDAFIDKTQSQMAEDVDGSPVYLGKSAWEIGYVQEKNPKVRFSDTKERAA